jgi:hypothetical protein
MFSPFPSKRGIFPWVFLFCFVFLGFGNLIWGLAFAWQALYHLSHTPSLFALSLFFRYSLMFLLGLPG